MRVPRRDVYRAFPELDPFKDEECRRYVAEARRLHRWAAWIRRAASLALMVAALPVAVVIA